MSSSDDALGGRLPLTERSALSEPQQQLYDNMTTSAVPWAKRAGFASQTSDSRFIGPYNLLLQSPVISGSFLHFQAVEEENTPADPACAASGDPGRGRRVALGLRALCAHSRSRSVTLPDHVARALAAGQLPGELSAHEQCAWRFTHQLTTQRQIEQPVYDQAHAMFGAQGRPHGDAARRAT
jgi:4-carboxymuconolactone decarboxylase